MNTNYMLLYEALKIFRDATLVFIKTHLEQAHGADWWEQGVVKGFPREQMEKLEEDFQRRFRSPRGPSRPSQEMYEILDVNWFTNILEANWKKVFADLFQNNRDALTLCKEVALFRNPVAHPETKDMMYDDAWRGLDSMERLLRYIDISASDQVKQIKQKLVASAGMPPPPSWLATPSAPARPLIPTTGQSLLQRIYTLVRGVFDRYAGSWMVWCDPTGHWSWLLLAAAQDAQLGGFPLLSVDIRTAEEVGSPLFRRELQGKLDRNESLVLLVPTPSDRLGWIWAQALCAEQIYTRSLREQLLEWGWRPQSLTTTDAELAVLARQNLQRDPATWAGGGLQPDLAMLLEVLAGGAAPEPGSRLILDLTIEQAGLPPLDTTAVPRWRAHSLARLLATQAHTAAPQAVGEGHELLIPAAQRALAMTLLARWRDSLRLSKKLPEAILTADRIASLDSQTAHLSVQYGPFLSHTAERAVFSNTCRFLAQQNGKDLLEAFAAMEPDLAQHTDGLWGDDCSHPQAIPWDELLRLSRAARMLLAGAALDTWPTPEAAITWYTGEGWRMDQAGEEILRNLRTPTSELVAVITPLRTAYRARWERSLIAWTEIWVGAGCPIPAIPTAGERVRDLLEAPRATVVLVVDALRYDLGATLAEQLNAREGAQRAKLQPARAPLPSITALGMGMALPILEEELDADLVEGKWLLRRSGSSENLSVAAQRRAWWQTQHRVPAEALLELNEVLLRDIPPPTAARTRLVIWDDAIDKMGHDDELEAQGSSVVRDRYVQVIERLRDAGWRRIVIVTDHGFIHWAGGEEKNIAPPVPNPAYQSRRALAYPPSTLLSGPQALAPGGRWRIALAPGAACFRTYGGLGYFHGGASLQEWITPCVQIEWPLTARPVQLVLQPLPQVLSQRPKVTLQVDRGRLFLEDTLSRQVIVTIREASARTILFHSAPTSVTPNQTQVEVYLAVTEGAVAERGTPLRMEIRDARTDEVLATGDSILMTELTGW